MSETKTIILIDARERVLLSWARDAFTFGTLIGTSYALNVIIPPSGWLNAALAVCWLLWTIGRSSKLAKRMTVSEARAVLEQLA